MKYLLSLVLALAVSACSGTAASKAVTPPGEMSRGVIDPYLKIQSALANDVVDGVQANATEVAAAASALGAPAAAINQAAMQLASTTELGDARVKFGALSEAMEAYVKAQQLKLPEEVKVAFCPMVQKPWLQAGATIVNPYYGKSMSSCGSFR